jgi:serine/threonine-protein kinase
MAVVSIDSLVEEICRRRLLPPDHERALTPQALTQFSGAQDLAQEMIRLDWLTPYQVQLLFEGRGDELAIGPYRVLAHLGEGGISQVYKAWHVEKNDVAALKVVRPELLANAEALRQFHEEVRALTQMAHVNVVQIFEEGEARGGHYFAMEYVAGMDLERLVQRAGPLSVARACSYARQAALGLQHAHEHGLVHRDVKPANLFLTIPLGVGPEPPGAAGDPLLDDGGAVIKILDWGLVLDRGSRPAGPLPELVGTADYLAPEQATKPDEVDVRADVYGLGCTLFYLLTGRPPFPAKSLLAKLQQHRQAEPPAVDAVRPDVPADLASVVRKMMAKRPEDRYRVPAGVAANLGPFCRSSRVLTPALPRPPLRNV